MNTEPPATPHPFDEATRLEAIGPADQGRWRGQASPAYWNMVGPFGGITAATVMQGLMRHPALLGEPVSITVNFVAPLGAQPFELQLRPVRTNRSTQHWTLDITQTDDAGTQGLVMTGTVFTGIRRPTWSQLDHPRPVVTLPEDVTWVSALPPVEWVHRYDIHAVEGGMPQPWSGHGESSRSRVWMRDRPQRPLDFPSLLAMSDFFYPRIWLRRGVWVAAGTVSMTVYFHASAPELQAVGSDFVLGQAEAQVFHQGFFDQTAQLWSRDGHLLVTTHQIVYYKD